MELVIGKKFKFEVWEVIVQKMALNEVAKFHVDKSVSLMATKSKTNESVNTCFFLSLAAVPSISIHSENSARYPKAIGGEKALLWHDITKRGHRIQGFG